MISNGTNSASSPAASGISPRVAIVGAGLGGVTAAIILQRAGYPVTIYEQAAALERIGAGIGVNPNMMNVMRPLGLAETLADLGVAPDRHLSREWDTGNILYDPPLREWEAKYGSHNLVMHRGDLLHTLEQALLPGTIQFDHHLQGLETRGETVSLQFSNGQQFAADFVIGADGVNSRVREILLGVEAPDYSGFVAYRSIFPAALLGANPLSCDITKWWSDSRYPQDDDRHFIVYYLTQRRDELYFVTGSPEPHWHHGTSNVPAGIDEIRACYEGFHPEVQRVIAACPAATKWPLLERKPLTHWGSGPVALLGDACHPMKPHMGQGANMAIEDAAVLVRCLQAYGRNLSDVSRIYELNRRDRTSRVQRESRANLWMKHGAEPDWLFGYDAMTVPLVDPDNCALLAGLPA